MNAVIAAPRQIKANAAQSHIASWALIFTAAVYKRKTPESLSAPGALTIAFARDGGGSVDCTLANSAFPRLTKH